MICGKRDCCWVLVLSVLSPTKHKCYQAPLNLRKVEISPPDTSGAEWLTPKQSSWITSTTSQRKNMFVSFLFGVNRPFKIHITGLCGCSRWNLMSHYVKRTGDTSNTTDGTDRDTEGRISPPAWDGLKAKRSAQRPAVLTLMSDELLVAR